MQLYYKEQGSRIEQDPDQNTNDLDKCLQAIKDKFLNDCNQGCNDSDDEIHTKLQVFVYGAFGGRFDQEMARRASRVGRVTRTGVPSIRALHRAVAPLCPRSTVAKERLDPCRCVFSGGGRPRARSPRALCSASAGPAVGETNPPLPPCATSMRQPWEFRCSAVPLVKNGGQRAR